MGEEGTMVGETRDSVRQSVWGVALRLVVVGCGASLLSSCINENLTASRSSSILVIERIGAASGGTNEDPIPTLLQSDVLTNGSVFDDIGRVTARIALKDPGTSENPSSPTSANFITVTRYRVVYRRTDGRNTPGVDVPFPVDGAVTFTVVSGPQTAEFVLVRASAKLEAPLRPLVAGGGGIVINTIAEVTFYGRDQTGAELIATGTVTVNFADWADPESATS
jgi:hypothetical protein